jgi:plasmid stabilization system protein ParE
MNRVPIVIEPAAKSDIRAARDYYSDKGENTSERFRDELMQVFMHCIGFRRTRTQRSGTQ